MTGYAPRLGGKPYGSSSHGGGVRGELGPVRSAMFEGRFGRIFRTLAPAEFDPAALQTLAAQGNMSSEPEAQDGKPAAAPEDPEDPLPRPRGERRHRRGLHLPRPVHRPRHHLRSGQQPRSPERSRRPGGLPHAPARPRLGLRPRPRRPAVPVHLRRPALRAGRGSWSRGTPSGPRTFRASSGARTPMRPSVRGRRDLVPARAHRRQAQRRERDRLPAARRHAAVPQPAGRQPPGAGASSRCRSWFAGTTSTWC